MKRSDRIAEAMGEIDDRFINEVQSLGQLPKRAGRLRWAAAAACICLCFLLSVIFVPKLLGDEEIPDIDTDHYKGENMSEGNREFDLNFDGSAVSSGSEGVLVEAVVSVIQDDEYHSYVSGVVIESDRVGEKIGDVWVRTCWRNFSLGEDRDVTSVRGEMYKIRGVDEKAIVCVKYLDEVEWLTTTHYYSYTNPLISATSLSEFFSSLGTAEYLNVSDTASVRFKERGEKDTTLVSSALLTDSAAVEDAFLCLKGEARSMGEDFKSEILDGCDLQVYLPLSVTCAKSSAVLFDNGYLLISLGGSSYLFDVGEESAEGLIGVIKDHSVENSSGVAVETTATVAE